MKRIAIIAILLLALLLSSCAASSSAIEPAGGDALHEFLIASSLELTGLISRMAESDGYIGIYTSADGVMDVARDLSGSEYLNPSGAVIVSISDAGMLSVFEDHIGSLDITDELLDHTLRRFFSSLPNLINAPLGVDVIAATSILSAGKSFLRPGGFLENTCVILSYPDSATFTMFTKSGDGIISASATFVFLTDEMKGAISASDVESYLYNAFRISSAEVVYFDGDEISDYLR